MRFLSWLVAHCPTVLGSSHWDFLLCSMLSWLKVRHRVELFFTGCEHFFLFSFKIKTLTWFESTIGFQ